MPTGTTADGSTTLHKSTFVAEAMLLAIGELSGASVVGYASETQYSNPWVHEGFPYRQQQEVGGGMNHDAGGGNLPDLPIAPPVDWTNMVGLDQEATAAL